MFTFNSNSRRGVNLLSAGAAAVLVSMGLAASVARANYIWDPLGHSGAGTDGSGTWNNTTANWWNGVSGSAPVVWTDGQTAVFGRGSTSPFTVTMGYDPSANGLILGEDANYTLAGTSTYNTITESGQLILKRNTGSGNAGTLTLQGVTVDNSTYNHNGAGTISGVYDNGILNIGDATASATLDVQQIGAGGGSGITNSTAGSLGTINVNSGSTLALESSATSPTFRLQIDFGVAPGAGTGGIVNVNGGAVSVASGGIIWLSDVNTAGGSTTSVGTMNVGVGGTGGSVTAPEMETAGAYAQTGILNVDSGTVTLNGGTSISANAASSVGSTLDVNVSGGTLNASGTITSESGATTNVDVSGGSLTTGSLTGSGATNLTISGGTATVTGSGISTLAGNSGAVLTLDLNGGILAVHQIAGGVTGASTVINFNGGTLQALQNNVGMLTTNVTYPVGPTVNILGGGAIIDNAGVTAYVYVPLLAGGSGAGGLTVTNSGSGGALVLAGGANTYTGPTEIKGGATLNLNYHGSAATIADSSLLEIDSGGTFNMESDSAGQQISVGGLTVSDSSIDVLLTANLLQNIMATTTAAAVSGTNIINVAAQGTSLTTGTYNLIADSAGGLNGPGIFAFNAVGDQTETVTVNSINYVLTLGNTSTAETLTVGAVPEPAAVALLAVGALGGLLLLRRRKPAA